MIRQKLQRKEKIDLIPIDILIFYMNLGMMKIFFSPVFFLIKFFWPIKVILVEWIEARSLFPVELLNNCHFYEKFFVKNDEAMKKYLLICATREGVTYSFDNGQITNTDNFKYLGDVAFTVYFDFETTTSGSAFFDPKIFVVSHYQIYSFHPSLNLDKIVIFRSFQQTAHEIYNLSHFKREHI